MKFFRIFQRGFEAFAFFRQDMDDDRMIAGLGKFKRADEQRQVVAVDRPEITHAHFFEQYRAAVTAATPKIADDDDHDRDQSGAFAELHRQVRPESLHPLLPVDRRRTAEVRV